MIIYKDIQFETVDQLIEYQQKTEMLNNKKANSGSLTGLTPEEIKKALEKIKAGDIVKDVKETWRGSPGQHNPWVTPGYPPTLVYPWVPSYGPGSDIHLSPGTFKSHALTNDNHLTIPCSSSGTKVSR